MMRQTFLIGVLALVIAGCSDSVDDTVTTQLIAHDSRLADLDNRLLETKTVNQERMDEFESRLHAMISQLREEMSESVGQLVSLKASLSELIAQQAEVDLVIASLKDDVARLTEQMSRTQAARTSVARRAAHRTEPTKAAVPAKAITPEFDVMGIELRGGRSFVAVASRSAVSLSDVQLMEPGDWFAGWKLGQVRSSTAEFVSDAGTVELTLR